MKRLIYMLSIVAVAFAVSSCMESRKPRNFNHLIDDGSVAFIQHGLESSQADLEASKIAQSVSKNRRVLAFANMIIANHDTVTDGLEKIAINNKVRGGDSISIANQNNISTIKALSGAEFDRSYIQMMVNSHQAVVKSYKIASTDKIEEIQQFARRTLPILKTQLDSATAICTDLKAD